MKNQNGTSLIIIIVFIAILATFGMCALQWGILQIKSTQQTQEKEMVFQIAEAGI